MFIGPQHDSNYFYRVDIFLETDAERAQSDEELERAACELIDSEGIEQDAVTGLYFYVRSAGGKWVEAKRNADGKLVPVS